MEDIRRQMCSQWSLSHDLLERLRSADQGRFFGLSTAMRLFSTTDRLAQQIGTQPARLPQCRPQIIINAGRGLVLVRVKEASPLPASRFEKPSPRYLELLGGMSPDPYSVAVSKRSKSGWLGEMRRSWVGFDTNDPFPILWWNKKGHASVGLGATEHVSGVSQPIRDCAIGVR